MFLTSLNYLVIKLPVGRLSARLHPRVEIRNAPSMLGRPARLSSSEVEMYPDYPIFAVHPKRSTLLLGFLVCLVLTILLLAVIAVPVKAESDTAAQRAVASRI